MPLTSVMMIDKYYEAYSWEFIDIIMRLDESIY